MEFDQREGSDITADFMVLPYEEPSQVIDFYKNSKIFITGASGFLGCLLVEKLLRSCPDLGHIYLLMREKRGKTQKERLNEIFNDLVYDKLRLANPHFYDKVSIIPGDCNEINLGLKISDITLIEEQIEVIFHVAATVRFDESIKKATNINVRATRDLLTIAKTMKNLRAFVHISTAYSNCINKEVDEVFYETPINSDQLIQLCNMLQESVLHTITPEILGKWPNTYAFTKAIAESCIKEHSKNVPVTIVRPSIVVSTSKEPVAGWTNSLYGPNGLSVGGALGVVHAVLANTNHIMDFVPVDYCINAMIVAGWQIGLTKGFNYNKEVIRNEIENYKVDDNIPIYNYISSSQNPLRWGDYLNKVEYYKSEVPSNRMIMYPYYFVTANIYLYTVLVYLTHYLPGLIVDGILRLTGRKPILLRTYKKIHKAQKSVQYFSIKEWKFRNDNTQKLWTKLNGTDQRLFEFDMKKLEWTSFLDTAIRGARVYLLKDPLETIPKAIRKLYLYKFIHYVIVSLILYVICRIIFAIILLMLWK